jgi:hypothetical protein
MLLEAVLEWLGRLFSPFADSGEPSPVDPLLTVEGDEPTWG